MDEIKLKDIYNTKPLKGDDSLVQWHNQVIEKVESELSISDVARCIRQKLFVAEAYEMLLVYLIDNPYAGDMFPGELLEKASEVETEIILKHVKTLREVIEKAKQFMETYAWESEDDRLEFEETILKLEDIIPNG